MDPLAHTLVGAALARTRLARGLPLATTTLVAAANLPDVDVLAYFGGEDAALAFRRGPTHGPLGFLLLPLLLIAALRLVWRLRRGNAADLPIQRLTALAYLGALTHPLLDLLNVYGVRLLSPFSDRWYYGDVLFIVDPWFWLTLGIGAFLAREPTRPAAVAWAVAAAATTYLMLRQAQQTWAVALWSTAVVAALVCRLTQRDALLRHRERIAASALALWTMYVGTMTVAAAVARRDVAAALAARNIAPVESAMVAPVPVDPRPRDVVVELPDSYRFGRYSLASRTLALEEGFEPKPADTAEIATAFAAPSVQGFLRWARFPFVRVARSADTTRVHLLDGRYVREVPDRGRRFGSAVVELSVDADGVPGVRPPAVPDR